MKWPSNNRLIFLFKYKNYINYYNIKTAVKLKDCT